ncbi:hypothetical protein ILYODFUR_038473 [Ilyodon furcidens]|uniref:Secreted protein n=1 Tax=Ilyodon furcidens TaxID=33524 RepID=A0ABV0VN05_9TELE
MSFRSKDCALVLVLMLISAPGSDRVRPGASPRRSEQREEEEVSAGVHPACQLSVLFREWANLFLGGNFFESSVGFSHCGTNTSHSFFVYLKFNTHQNYQPIFL